MNIAILGAGVAGISTAIALKQKGFESTVYERHHSPSHQGAGIVVWPNAAYILDQLGVLDDVARVSGRPSYMRRISRTGEALGAIDIGQINRHMNYPSYSVFRKDLQAILTSKLMSLGGHIHYNHGVTGIDSIAPKTTTVHFQNGQSITPEIIVGADGRMNSYARHYVLGNNTPTYQKFINWTGTFESSINVFQDISIADYWGVGERFGIVPVAPNKAYWAGGIASPDSTPRRPADYKKELMSVFSDWPDPVKIIIEGTPVERINKIHVHDHDPANLWHKHNLIMIGDAAHAPLPTSGQGACQALEDAWHLADRLSQPFNTLQQAFEQFTAMRLEKTTQITMAARGFAASLFNRDIAFCTERNEISKATDFEAAAKGMSGLWGTGLPLQTK